MQQDEKMREALYLKDQVMKEIEECEERLEYLRRHLEMLDTVLKGASFARASSLGVRAADNSSKKSTPDRKSPPAQKDPPERRPAPDASPIKINRDGDTVAHMTHSADRIEIVLVGGLGLSPDTPPFRTFFLDRILGGMREADRQECAEGKLPESGAMSYEVLPGDSELGRIVIRNYRNEDRLREIRSSVGWALSRMMERSK